MGGGRADSVPRSVRRNNPFGRADLNANRCARIARACANASAKSARPNARNRAQAACRWAASRVRPPCLKAFALPRGGPLALPPCMRHRPLRIAGARQGHPCRVRAPHRGAAFRAAAFPIMSMACSRCMGLFAGNVQILRDEGWNRGRKRGRKGRRRERKGRIRGRKGRQTGRTRASSTSPHRHRPSPSAAPRGAPIMPDKKGAGKIILQAWIDGKMEAAVRTTSPKRS
jgi:hypothetical protein